MDIGDDTLHCREKYGGCTLCHKTLRLPNTANTHIESHIFAKLVPVLTTLCMLGLKFLEVFCDCL